MQKLSQEIDDITAEALSDKMMSEVKSQEELHNLTIWYPLLTGSRKGMNSAINDRVKSIISILSSNYLRKLVTLFWYWNCWIFM